MVAEPKKRRRCIDTSYVLVPDERLAQLSVSDYWRASLKQLQQQQHQCSTQSEAQRLPLQLQILSMCFGVHLPEQRNMPLVTTGQHPRPVVSTSHIFEILKFHSESETAGESAIQDLVHRGALVPIDLHNALLSVCDTLPATVVELIVEYTHESLTDELIRLAEEHKQFLSLPDTVIGAAHGPVSRFSPLYQRAVTAGKFGDATSYIYPFLGEPVQGSHDHTCHHVGVIVDQSDDLCSVLWVTNHCEVPEFIWPNVEVLILASDASDFTGPATDDFEAVCIRCPKLRLIEWTLKVSDSTDGRSFYRRAYCTDFSNPRRARFQYYD